MKKENFKHTPGPWHFDGHGINSDDGARISKCCTKQWDENGKLNPVFEANSILQAAAPEMLEALDRIIRHAENFDFKNDGSLNDGRVRAIITAASTAIKKALGE